MKRLFLGQMSGEARVHVQASPHRVYDIVSDVTRMGEWSPECHRCVWLEGATGPAVGACFRGYNRRGWVRWSLRCRVTEAEPGRIFAFETLVSPKRAQSRWRYEMQPEEGGTLLRESFEVLWYFRIVALLLFGGSRARLAQLEEGMSRSLQRIKAAAEAAEATTREDPT